MDKEETPNPLKEKKVIQPSESFKQELQTQKTSVASEPQPAQPQVNPADIYPDPGRPVPNPPKRKFFSFGPKTFLIGGLTLFAAVGVTLAVLVMTNVIALKEFKNISYTNSQGVHYKLDFYTKHSTTQSKAGGEQLVSKVSKDGKFPLLVIISTSSDSTAPAAYSRVKDCNNFTKAFDVQNNNLNQKISVCDVFGKTQVRGQNARDSVYIAGFMHNDQAHIVTIGQDYSSINLSSPSDAQDALTKFGMQPYKKDIEKIISSINVE